MFPAPGEPARQCQLPASGTGFRQEEWPIRVFIPSSTTRWRDCSRIRSKFGLGLGKRGKNRGPPSRNRSVPALRSGPAVVFSSTQIQCSRELNVRRRDKSRREYFKNRAAKRRKICSPIRSHVEDCRGCHAALGSRRKINCNWTSRFSVS